MCSSVNSVAIAWSERVSRCFTQSPGEAVNEAAKPSADRSNLLILVPLPAPNLTTIQYLGMALSSARPLGLSLRLAWRDQANSVSDE
jgi:hypothetical protein